MSSTSDLNAYLSLLQLQVNEFLGPFVKMVHESENNDWLNELDDDGSNIY